MLRSNSTYRFGDQASSSKNGQMNHATKAHPRSGFLGQEHQWGNYQIWYITIGSWGELLTNKSRWLLQHFPHPLFKLVTLMIHYVLIIIHNYLDMNLAQSSLTVILTATGYRYCSPFSSTHPREAAFTIPRYLWSTVSCSPALNEHLHGYPQEVVWWTASWWLHLIPCSKLYFLVGIW